MCVMYVRVIDKADATDEHFRAGEVVFIRPDGWIFGDAELASPQHRVIVMPGVPQVLFSEMESQLIPFAGRVIAKRLFCFNEDAVKVLLGMQSPVNMSASWVLAMSGAIENKIVGAALL